jgi:hypothetical protein
MWQASYQLQATVGKLSGFCKESATVIAKKLTSNRIVNVNPNDAIVASGRFPLSAARAVLSEPAAFSAAASAAAILTATEESCKSCKDVVILESTLPSSYYHL